MISVGIDLGTTNSLLAIVRDGQPEIVCNKFDERITPSVVSFLEDDTVVVGKTARERVITNPKVTFGVFKRDMGSSRKYGVFGKMYRPTDLSALLLMKMVEEAKEVLGDDIEKAVISVPAYFTDFQRQSTMEAARIAGIEPIGIINEPTAAALAYHLHEGESEKIVAIIDLGGGTYDVSILDIFGSVVEVKSVAGDNYLGGEDFDVAIMEFFCKKHNIFIDTLVAKDINKLKYIAEQFKFGFDRDDYQEAEVELRSGSVKITMTKKEFNDACEPILTNLKKPIKQALNDSDLELSEIDEIILVGGSTKMPIVKNHISKLFGRLPLCHLNPDEVVALGAAVYAGLREKNIELSDTVMTDVCPYTLGSSHLTKIEGGTVLVYDPIIERNTTVPVSKTREYVAYNEKQRNLRIPVYQGENFDPQKNILLGEFKFKISSGSVEDSLTNIRFTYDRNGILEVITENVKTGEKQRQILLNNNKMSDVDIEKCIEQIKHLKIHPNNREDNILYLARAEKYYELALGEKRELIAREILMFKAALEKEDEGLINNAKKRMDEFFQHLERV